MKVGDLISFKPDGWDNDEWSAPGIITREYGQYEPPMWVVWVWPDSEQFIINEDDYEILLLTTSSQESS